MTFVLVAAFVLYGLLVLFLYRGWVKAIGKTVQTRTQPDHFISVVIPARNEERNIVPLLNDLSVQHYHQDHFEVIVVNDHSEDSTLEVVNEINFLPNCRIISSGGHGKKSALSTGIKNAKGNIILTTDADCRVGVSWLQSFNDSFSNDGIKMVFGPVKIEGQSLFSSIQAIEFASLIGSGAATLSFGFPTMCNGANLAFRKEAFVEVKGYEGNENIASGDDEFLMRKIKQQSPAGIFFNNSATAIVVTRPQPSLGQFVSQRLRWAGKWKHPGDVTTKLLALFIFLFHVSVTLLPVTYFLNPRSGYILLSIFIWKIILEYLLLRSVTAWLGVRWHWLSFVLLQIFYPVYAIIVGFASLLVTPYWKGRK